MSALTDYANSHLGDYLDNGQGGYAGECVSLTIRVAHDVYGIPYGTLYCSNTGGARDLFEQYDGRIPQYFDRIANDPNDYGQLPQEGDFIVWGTYMGKYGHVAVVLSGNPLRVFQQLGTPVFEASEIRQYANYNGVLGWLRPKVQQSTSTSQGGDDVITNNDAGRLRVISSEVKGWDFNQVHSGQTDAQELKAWVGQPWTRFIDEAWAESEKFRYHRIDAINYYDNVRPSVEATRDQLARTNVDLSAKNISLGQANSDLKAQLSKAQEEVAAARKIIEGIEKCPVPSGIDADTKAKIDETNTVVKSIKGMLINFIGYVKARLGK